MNPSDSLKLFGLNNLAVEAKIKSLQSQLNVDLGRADSSQTKSLDDAYYPQFPERLRIEAAEMARHYRVFYCLENFVRELIVEVLSESIGPAWWDTNVPEAVRTNAERNRQREIDLGVTPRSSDPIDYTTFGELGEIIKLNPNKFVDLFPSIKAVERVLSQLNTLRGPIAHCKPLAEDEIVRLHLALRDLFRAMGETS